MYASFQYKIYCWASHHSSKELLEKLYWLLNYAHIPVYLLPFLRNVLHRMLCHITIPIRNTYSLVTICLSFYPQQELKYFHIISQYTFKFWQNDELIENHYKEILHIWSGEVNSFNFGKYESGWENPIQSFVS